MASNSENFRTPRRAIKRGSAKSSQRTSRPYSPCPPNSGRYHRPAYQPSTTPVTTAILEESSSDSTSTQIKRPSILGLLECSYKLNYSDTKRVIVGLDLKNACMPFITIGKVGGLCIKLSYHDWCELLKCESVITSYFYNDDVPHTISFGNLVLKFKTVFGTKSIVLEESGQSDDKAGVYLAKSSWYGVMNLAECVRLRWEERSEWSLYTLKTLDLYLDSILNTRLEESEDGENQRNFTREYVNAVKVNPEGEIGKAPPFMNTVALTEEIRSVLRTHDGTHFLQEEIISRESKIMEKELRVK